jgi:homoserine acetyltransferase
VIVGVIWSSTHTEHLGGLHGADRVMSLLGVNNVETADQVSKSCPDRDLKVEAACFPDVTIYDQVEQQHKLVISFGIETFPLVTGCSMGAGQTYQWAVSYPDMVARACPFCGSSKTSERNIVFLELSSSRASSPR